MKKFIYIPVLLSMAVLVSCNRAPARLTDRVNPLFGTATLWDSKDLGYEPTHRAWGAEVFPGASLPNAMVQVTPVTMFGSGSGYQYEDTVILGFFHTSMGHWNLGNVPILPYTGEIAAGNYGSGYSHDNESARPGYYRVMLERYGIDAEMTSTTRCAYHRFTFRDGDAKNLMLNLSRTNSRRPGTVWDFRQIDGKTFSGSQGTRDAIYFYAVANHDITGVDSISSGREQLTLLHFADGKAPLELKIGFSFVSVEKAKKNLEAEVADKDFAGVADEADRTWETLLSKIEVSGGTEKHTDMLYTCIYRSLLWPAVRSDVDGEFTDPGGNVVKKGFHYYTTPALWDDYRNKLILMGMLSPEVTADVISSMTERAQHTGFMPIYFHGDHASPFITGSYLRGIRGFDVDSAYHYMLRNATVENPRARLYLDEYNENGWIAENDVKNPTTGTEVDEAKAAVTKTLEYAYDDYAVALLARELGDGGNHDMLMRRSGNYKNLFDPSTGFMRGRLAGGEWWEPYDPEYPYYVFMYREANGWQSTFFAPHDPRGLVSLYGSDAAFEQKLDEMFSTPWGGYEAYNFTTFLGQYCPGNQPSQGVPYMYYFVDKQEKAQAVIDTIMNDYYAMGPEELAYAGMDDSGGLSAWWVLNAIGLYTLSPADPEYIVTVPVFDKVVFSLGDTPFTISKVGNGRKITEITCGGQNVEGYFVAHEDLKQGKELVITTEAEQ
jgi:predicted alpha-1,2-mannosidase